MRVIHLDQDRQAGTWGALSKSQERLSCPGHAHTGDYYPFPIPAETTVQRTCVEFFQIRPFLDSLGADTQN